LQRTRNGWNPLRGSAGTHHAPEIPPGCGIENTLVYSSRESRLRPGAPCPDSTSDGNVRQSILRLNGRMWSHTTCHSPSCNKRRLRTGGIAALRLGGRPPSSQQQKLLLDDGTVAVRTPRVRSEHEMWSRVKRHDRSHFTGSPAMASRPRPPLSGLLDSAAPEAHPCNSRTRRGLGSLPDRPRGTSANHATAARSPRSS
jgi:hypothetical protein